jgi:hypothetical protein
MVVVDASIAVCCPGQKPPFWAVTQPARPHKNITADLLWKTPRALKRPGALGQLGGVLHCGMSVLQSCVDIVWQIAAARD